MFCLEKIFIIKKEEKIFFLTENLTIQMKKRGKKERLMNREREREKEEKKREKL